MATKYWKRESIATGELVALFKVTETKNGMSGYIYKNGKWQPYEDIVAKAGYDDDYDYVLEADVEELKKEKLRLEEFYRGLGEKTGRELNAIISLVQRKVPKAEVVFKDSVEEEFFDSLVKQAEDHVNKYGSWPVFELCEVD